MNIRRILILFVVLLGLLGNIAGQNKSLPNDENVVAQMNYCINTLTSIVHNKSMSVLEHESDQLVNNLTMQQIIGLPEIRDFRIELMDAVSKFEITEEERHLLRRIQSIKRDNMKWAAISNALNPTMLLTGGGGFGPQLAFQVLLTAARSVVEYKTMQGEQNIEELQAMWELRKEDMQTINDLRKSAHSIVFALYDKYHLSESDRLTESSANLFSEYISIPDAARRVRILEDNYDIYKRIPEYYYHLGMAYLDNGDYSKAKNNFSTYLVNYDHAPILRYDERSGCIALAMLTYDKTLSSAEKEKLISIAIKNLPSNSAAVLQCAMVYIYEFNQPEKGFQLIRAGVDDPNESDKDILFMAAANLMPFSKQYSTVYRAICDTFKNTYGITLGSFITYLIYSQGNVWEQIGNVLSFSDCYSRLWYTLWIGKSFNDNFHVLLSNKVTYSPNDVSFYLEEHSEDEIKIYLMKSNDCYSITEDDINDIDCFKANKNLKYLYVESINDGMYKLKPNVNLDKIIDETWPRQSEFTLSESDIEDIVDFCKEYKSPTDDTEIELSRYKVDSKRIDANGEFSIFFYGDSLRYKPYHSKKQKGYYVRLIISNGFQVLYKYDNDSDTLLPYMYSDGHKYWFANSAAKQEYTYKEVPTQDKPSWWNAMWNSLKGWFSNEEENTSNENTLEKSKDEPSWLNKMWTSITNWFSSDEEESSSNNNEVSTKENDDEPSWWSKAWSAIKDLF